MFFITLDLFRDEQAASRTGSRHNAALPEGRTRTYDNGRCITALTKGGLVSYIVSSNLPSTRSFLPAITLRRPSTRPFIHHALEFAITIIRTSPSATRIVTANTFDSVIFITTVVPALAIFIY